MGRPPLLNPPSVLQQQTLAPLMSAEMYEEMLRGFAYHAQVEETSKGDMCLMAEPTFVRCIKDYMEAYDASTGMLQTV
jgi:hypothetical protein